MSSLTGFTVVFAVALIAAFSIDRLAKARANRLNQKAEKAKDCGDCVL